MDRDWGGIALSALFVLVGLGVLLVWAYMPVAMGLSVVDCWDDLSCNLPFGPPGGETTQHYSGLGAVFVGAGTLLAGLAVTAAPAYVVHYNLREKDRWAPWAKVLSLATLLATVGASVALHALY